MYLQYLIVALIILGALLYVGNILRRKVKAFDPKDTSCGGDCGCEAKSSRKIAKV